MERVRFIEHRGQRVLLLDYSDLAEESVILEMIEERTDIVAQQPRGSVLTLIDVTHSKWTRTAIQRVKDANVLDHPYVRRAAVVGYETMAPKGSLEAVGTFASRTWGQFATREEALAWLTGEVADSATGT